MQSWKIRLGLMLTMLAMLLMVSMPVAVADEFDIVCEVDDVEWVSGADGELDSDTDGDWILDSDLYALVELDCDVEDEEEDEDEHEDWNWDEEEDEHEHWNWDEHENWD